MFIQVVQAKVSDEAGLRRMIDRWQEEVKPGATGYLGSTAGITDDGTFVVLARFESAEAAQANSDRPEQGAWFAETEKCFDGEPTFLNSATVTTWREGGSDDAGFVQIMRGRSEDVARMHEVLTRHPDELHEIRPEILGGLMIDDGDGQYVDAFYFTSEEAAREGEGKDMPEEFRAEMEEGMALMGDVTFLDLRDPILQSA
jgi:hypothetical protein